MIPAGDSVFSLGFGLEARWISKLDVPFPFLGFTPLALYENKYVLGGSCDGRDPLGNSNETYAFALDVKTGQLVWKTPTMGAPVGVAVSKGVAVVAGWRKSGVVGLDAESGKLLWQLPLEPIAGFPQDPMPVAISGKAVFFGTANGGGFYRVGLMSGNIEWHNSNVSSDSPCVVAGSNVFVVDQNRNVAVLDSETGNVVLQSQIGASTVAIIAPCTLLVSSAMQGTVAVYRVE